MSFYSVCKKTLAGLIRFWHRIEIRGAENEPEGSYLICSNHISLADPVILGASLKGNPKYMAKKELLRIPIFGLLIKSLGAYPVDRAGNDVKAIKQTIKFLQDGQPVIMFPQGTRNKGVDPKQTSVKNGCAMIARRAGVSVLPVFIYTKDYRVKLFKKTVVNIGKCISTDELSSAMTSPEDYKSAANLIFSRITDMEDDR